MLKIAENLTVKINKETKTTINVGSVEHAFENNYSETKRKIKTDAFINRYFIRETKISVHQCYKNGKKLIYLLIRTQKV